jgi:hypothetical protein|tara:strand:- start:125 stop:700 length:576 start_codon:yes stop_codon:yes gene_type:complete
MNLVEFVPTCYSDVVHIARNMRELDAEEILPLIWGGTPENLAAVVIAAGGLATVALSGGVPVAAYGATQTRPKCWSVWMFATDQWPKVALSVTRRLKTEVIETIYEVGAVRADCWSMEGHHVAHRWLEMLGAKYEATLEDYGPTRKNFHCYSWTLSRLEKKNVYRPICPKGSILPGSSPPTGATRAATGQR